MNVHVSQENTAKMGFRVKVMLKNSDIISIKATMLYYNTIQQTLMVSTKLRKSTTTTTSYPWHAKRGFDVEESFGHENHFEFPSMKVSQLILDQIGKIREGTNKEKNLRKLKDLVQMIDLI